MDKLTIIVEAILISIIIMIAVFALLPFEFTGSRLIDGYNITFQERCGAGNESLAFYNYSSCVGWTSEINDINLVSGQTILQTYTTCVHEKWHNLITNMTRKNISLRMLMIKQFRLMTKPALNL